MNSEIILNFCIGPMNAAFYTAISAHVANTLSKIMDQKVFKPIAEDFLRRAFAYTIFVIVANRMDAAGITASFGWQSTQYLVVVGLGARETIDLLKRISIKWGIAVPFILTDRLTRIENGDVQQSPDNIDPVQLDHKINNLKNNMDKLKELRRLERELEDLQGTSSSIIDEPYIESSAEALSDEGPTI